MEKVNLKDKTVLFYDNGLFLGIAQRISQDFKRVLYYSPWKSAFPKSKLTMVGHGIDGIERINEFWDYVDEADLIVFPDVYDGDIQLQLRRMGKRVFGGGKGEEMELFRYEMNEHMKELNLPVAKIEKVIGLKKLRESLKKKENQYVKISIFRGNFETFHHINYKLSEPILDELEHKLGAEKEIMEFIVEESIDGEDIVETGFDGFTIDGQFPKKALFGYEIKDLGYIIQTKDYDKISPLITGFNDAVSETFRKYQYRGFFSTEIRVGKDKLPYQIDMCSRSGSPPNEIYQEIISNISEILWYGSEGVLIEPEYEAKYGIEVMIHSDWADENWQAVYFPEEIKRWVKWRNLTKINGTYYIVPMDNGLPEIGAVIAIGNSVEDCIKKVKGYAEQIEGYRLDIKIGSIDAMTDVIEKGKKIGISF